MSDLSRRFPLYDSSDFVTEKQHLEEFDCGGGGGGGSGGVEAIPISFIDKITGRASSRGGF